jgi:hypothetical protein
MSILSNALPGLRDLRGPLIAGYLWLLLAWLVFKPDIQNRPTTEPAAALYDLGHDVGRAGVLVGVSVLAYIVGSLSQDIANVPRNFWRGAATLLQFGSRSWLINDHRIVDALDRATRLVEQNEARLGDDASAWEREVRMRADAATSEVRSELDLPATLLVGDQEQLFSEVDRLKSEADFRFALVPPLVALAVYLAVVASAWWLVALLAPILLFVQATKREDSGRQLMVEAFYVGLIKPSAPARYSDWVESLPTLWKEGAEPYRGHF